MCLTKLWVCAHLLARSSVMLTVVRSSVTDMLPSHPIKYFPDFMNAILGLSWFWYFYDDRFDRNYVFKIVDCERG